MSSILHTRWFIGDENIPKIQRTSLKAQVYEYLKQAIINGELKIGEIYSEQYFANKLSISRTPVREAILQLKHENLVEIKANRGIVIKPLYLDEITKIIETRLAIEGYSSSILAKNLSNKRAIDLINNLVENLNKQKTILHSKDAYYEFMLLDLEFHQKIIDFTENSYFTEIIKMLRTRLEIATLKSLYTEHRLEAAYQEHILLFEAIKTRDASKAFNAFDFHMQKTLEIMKKCYDTWKSCIIQKVVCYI